LLEEKVGRDEKRRDGREEEREAVERR